MRWWRIGPCVGVGIAHGRFGTDFRATREVSTPPLLSHAVRRVEEDPLLCAAGSVRVRVDSQVAIHARRMHDHEKAKVEFPCDWCGVIFKNKNTMLNHRESCGGLPPTNTNLKRCERCCREISKANIARHRQACTTGDEGRGARGNVRSEDKGAKQLPTDPIKNLVPNYEGCCWRQTWPVIFKGVRDGRGGRARRLASKRPIKSSLR